MKKIFTVILLSIAVLLTFWACESETTLPVDDTSVTSPDLTDSNVSSEHEEEPAVESIDIETIGGAVIVGEIGYDEAGWYFIPEQPLNITYNYFYEKPSVFTNQARIRMIDPKDDGMDKSLYLGQTVTVQGEFRFVRNDFETLYLLPYIITIGKTVAESYGDSELEAPQPQNLYDRTKPLPKYLESLIMDGKYIYNAFMLPEETLELMGNDFAVFYCDFVDAFLSYRTEVPCSEMDYAEMLSTIIFYDFPLFNACAEPFEFFKHYNRESQTISIEYKYGEDEHQDVINRFMNAADELLSSVTPEMTDIEKAKNIYHELCTRMVYDNSALENIERKNSYYAYLHNSGVCVTFANVYNQLLTQVGIQTTIATCEYDATMGHVWSVVTLDGANYFCDPTFELSHNNGEGYAYFGMNYADRTKDGLGENGIRVGKYQFSHTVLPEMIAEQSIK